MNAETALELRDLRAQIARVEALAEASGGDIAAAIYAALDADPTPCCQAVVTSGDTGEHTEDCAAVTA